MEHEILHRPSYAAVEVTLGAGESVVAESGAMAWMEGAIETRTSTRGGVMGALKRSMLAGESFFQNTYTAGAGGGRVAFAHGSAGDLVAYGLDRGELILQKGAYVASEPGVKCDSKWSGLKGLFNEGLFMLRCTGSGLLFFGSYGDIEAIDVDGEYLVDNGYAVAWEPGLDFQLTSARKVRSFLFSDQIMLRMRGRGRLWIQSRSPQSFANWVHPFRPVESSNNSN